jgi:hypothetical protein
MDDITKTPKGPAPEQLAPTICKDYAAIISDERTDNHQLVERAMKVGADLIYCKSVVAHGNWQGWLKSYCPTISKRTVERWMKLAENRSKIEEEIKTRTGKNDTVTFLTLREALAIANGKPGRGGNGETNASDAYDRVSDNLVAKLKALAVDEADAAATKTAKALKETVATMKAGAKNT